GGGRRGARPSPRPPAAPPPPPREAAPAPDRGPPPPPGAHHKKDRRRGGRAPPAMKLKAAGGEERDRERGRQPVVRQTERRERRDPEDAEHPDGQGHPADLGGIAPRSAPRERPDRDGGGEHPRQGACDRDGQELERGQRDVLVGELPRPRH